MSRVGSQTVGSARRGSIERFEGRSNAPPVVAARRDTPGRRGVLFASIVFAIAAASCGGASQSPARAGAQSTYASGGAASESTSSDRSATAAPQSAAEPGTTRPTPTVTSTGTGGDSGDRMSYWQGQLDHASSQLSSSNECRDICRASGDICVAAHEICDLTGDGDRATPSDGRCSRARGACEQATRQRNGSCPVCPRE